MSYINRNKTSYDIFLDLLKGELVQPIIIASVLEGMQNGLVIQDTKTNPKSAFVLHDFGWAQLLGNPDDKFLDELSYILFSNQNVLEFKRLGIFSSRPNRLFDSFCNKFERLKLSIETRLSNTLPDTENFQVLEISPENGHLVSSELGLDLFSRNWSNSKIFFAESFGSFIQYKKAPVAACYAAAKSGKAVEIDIVTHECFRNKGLGSWVANAFLDQCKQKILHPSWDCFVDNSSSLSLAKKLGFKINMGPYSFYRYKPES